MTLALDAGKLARLLDDVLDAEDGADGLRQTLAAFADSEGVPY
jgi:hypothetical protein